MLVYVLAAIVVGSVVYLIYDIVQSQNSKSRIVIPTPRDEIQRPNPFEPFENESSPIDYDEENATRLDAHARYEWLRLFLQTHGEQEAYDLLNKSAAALYDTPYGGVTAPKPRTPAARSSAPKSGGKGQ